MNFSRCNLLPEDSSQGPITLCSMDCLLLLDVSSYTDGLTQFVEQAPSCLSSGHSDFTQDSIDQIVAGGAAKVQPLIRLVNLLAGDPNVVQSLSRGGMTKDLLEQQ